LEDFGIGGYENRTQKLYVHEARENMPYNGTIYINWDQVFNMECRY